MVDKDLEDMDGLSHILEVRADAKPGSKLVPLVPSRLVGMEAGGWHPLCHVMACMMVVKYYIVTGGRWHAAGMWSVGSGC